MSESLMPVRGRILKDGEEFPVGTETVLVPINRASFDAMVERVAMADFNLVYGVDGRWAETISVVRAEYLRDAKKYVRAALTLPAEWEPSDG